MRVCVREKEKERMDGRTNRGKRECMQTGM